MGNIEPISNKQSFMLSSNFAKMSKSKKRKETKGVLPLYFCRNTNERFPLARKFEYCYTPICKEPLKQFK